MADPTNIEQALDTDLQSCYAPAAKVDINKCSYFPWIFAMTGDGRQ